MKLTNPTDIPVADIYLTRASTGGYFDSTGAVQSAAINVPRFTYNNYTLAYEGLLIEPGRTNFCLNSTSISNTSRSVSIISGTTYTFSFYGAGTVVASGAYSATIVGSNSSRTTRTFTASSGTLTLNVTGLIFYVQVENGSFATSWIPTTTSAITRSPDLTPYLGIVSTTIVETVTAWDSGTTYAIGNRVRYYARIWESLQNSNTNHDPQDPAWWVEVGPNNTYGAFDSKLSAVSSVPHNTVFQYAFVLGDPVNHANSVSILGISASNSAMYPITVRIAVRKKSDNSLAVGSKTITSAETTQAIFNDLAVTGDIISVRIETTTLGSGSGTLSVSNILAGPQTLLGTTEYGATAGIVDYSKKDFDEFGQLVITERAFSKRLSAKVLVDNNDLNTVQRLLYSVRAKPCLWVGSDDSRFDEALTVYGFYRDFSTDIAYPDTSICNLEIEGLT